MHPQELDDWLAPGPPPQMPRSNLQVPHLVKRDDYRVSGQISQEVESTFVIPILTAAPRDQSLLRASLPPFLVDFGSQVLSTPSVHWHPSKERGGRVARTPGPAATDPHCTTQADHPPRHLPVLWSAVHAALLAEPRLRWALRWCCGLVFSAILLRIAAKLNTRGSSASRCLRVQYPWPLTLKRRPINAIP